MTSFTKFLAATAAIGGFAAPAAAQYVPYSTPAPQYQPTYPPQAYPQTPAYPGYAQPAYGYGQQQYAQPGYAYGQQQYGQSYSQSPVTSIIDQLLGNRYNVSDRTAIQQCATAAMSQASARYGNGYGNGYANGYGQQGYNRTGGSMRVTAITGVERHSNWLRVRGTMTSGYGGQQAYQNGYGSQNGNRYAYGNQSAVSFRCNVDYRGQVTDVRFGSATGYGR